MRDRFLEEPVDDGGKGIPFIASHKRPSVSQQTRVFLLLLEPQHKNHLYKTTHHFFIKKTDALSLEFGGLTLKDCPP